MNVAAADAELTSRCVMSAFTFVLTSLTSHHLSPLTYTVTWSVGCCVCWHWVWHHSGLGSAACLWNIIPDVGQRRSLVPICGCSMPKPRKPSRKNTFYPNCKDYVNLYYPKEMSCFLCTRGEKCHDSDHYRRFSVAKANISFYQ